MFLRSAPYSKHTENEISDEPIEETSSSGSNLIKNLKIAQNILRDHGHFRESDALNDVLITCAQPPELGGLGLAEHADLTEDSLPAPLPTRPEGRRGMTLSEKVFPLHDTGQRGSVAPSDLIRVDVDRVIASEASWAGMESTYNRLRKPGIFRNDRCWLAGDDVVDPRVNSLPKLASAEFLIEMTTNEAAGEHCLQYTHPEFCDRVKEGFNIVVAGKAFGCGSSRGQAVRALLGCGVKCIIAESFAFIFQRNMLNLGLLGITMPERSFHAAVEDGAEITIDFNDSIIDMDGQTFSFNLSPMERAPFHHGGIASAFRRFGSNLFEAITEGKSMGLTPDHGIKKSADLHPELQW
ncbi:Aconitase/3-isopropylmalate dehydratase [Aspergillus caelatus]|uniref:Aconitase/3-isopropylmalate dehydratase n=1 Tax=Aspergillus caelatus TaxID=61420 RepID=A0A5N7A1A4_9EURO|nr:Aconitase/3-isopropylmalate dehydratase [Aspergillus caelatus]KAE8363258.1 Aconitase/3-isopropylmalate dehydratase [Aspergillus caelatus]